MCLFRSLVSANVWLFSAYWSGVPTIWPVQRLASYKACTVFTLCSSEKVYTSHPPPPKGPSRTKNTMESEFQYGEKIWYGRSKTLHRGSGEERGPGSLGGPSSWYSHAQTAHRSRKPQAGTPSRAGTPCPSPFRKRCRRWGGGGPGRKGGPGSKGGRGPGSWCSSACTGARSVGIPRAGSPPTSRDPSHFPRGFRNSSFFTRKTTAVAKYYGFESCTIFSTEGSCGPALLAIRYFPGAKHGSCSNRGLGVNWAGRSFFTYSWSFFAHS